MPISYPGALTHIGYSIIRMRPKTVLDIGCGSGMFGFMARQYTDLDLRRYPKHSWQTKIDGIEVFPAYITDVHHYIYDHVYIGDAIEVLSNVPDYDLMICADVIEHMDEAKGKFLLELMHAKSKKFFVVTPDRWIPQGEVFGNPFERHIRQWTKEELEPFGKVLNLNRALTLEGYGSIK